MIRRLCLAVLLGLLALAPPGRAAEVRTVHVHFARGASEASIEGHVAGREAVHYLVGLRAGQMLRVVLHSGSDAVAFNVFEPGHVPGRDGALYVGELNGPQMEVRTTHNGEYLIQVFLNRAAARRGERAAFRLEVAATGGAPGRQGDERVPGTRFHATSIIRCARAAGQALGECRAGVERGRGRGNGQVTVFWPDGGNRVIFFEDLTPVRYDQSEADAGARMTVGRQGDDFDIRIGHQRFVIPEAVVAGG